jgi:glycosyltransferase involved in cell wall biosynthesis/SAM-dependent methyltransferase
MGKVSAATTFAPAANAGDPVGATVAVVITTYNHSLFLGDAIQSVLAQTKPPKEFIVVDDGSTDNPAAVVAGYPRIRLIQQSNQGLAAARNTGMEAATADMIIFLDADDRLLPIAIEAGLACYTGAPESGFVYGGHRRVGENGRPAGFDHYHAISSNPYRDFLRGNLVGMHAAVMYRRDRLMEAGGFDTDLSRCEDYDALLRMVARHPVASHPHVIAEYRRHHDNMSHDHLAMLKSALLVHGRQRSRAVKDAETAAAWKRGRSEWRRFYGDRILRAGQSKWGRDHQLVTAIVTVARVALISPGSLVSLGRSKIKRLLPTIIIRRLNWLQGRRSVPAPGSVDFGDLGRTRPISDRFGFDRGTPIDRYYIEAFLSRNSGDIRGRVLEIGDATYTCKFGGAKVNMSDVLHVHPGNPKATIVGDISVPGTLPGGAFDCLLLTQTLHLIYDMRAAVVEMKRALKPGGAVLVTVPGLSQIDRGEWGAAWFWSLTPAAARRLFGDVFGTAYVQVESHGNVFAATAFLQGVATEEVDHNKLDVRDDAYPLIVAVHARKPFDA